MMIRVMQTSQDGCCVDIEDDAQDVFEQEVRADVDAKKNCPADTALDIKRYVPTIDKCVFTFLRRGIT